MTALKICKDTAGAQPVETLTDIDAVDAEFKAVDGDKKK